MAEKNIYMIIINAVGYFSHTLTDTHVSRCVLTSVQVSVIFWQKINIMEDETIPVIFFDGLSVANIKKHGTVEPR